MILELVSIGFCIGIFVGISGVGGGSIMTPLLILVLRMNPLLAVGTDLLYSVPTKLFGAYVHRTQGTVDPKLVKTLVTGGIPGAAVGFVALLGLRNHFNLAQASAIVKHGVGLALFISAAVLALSVIIRLPHGNVLETPPDAWPRKGLIVIGAIVGFFVTLTSVGSGSVTLPLLYLALPRISLRVLVGSDIAFAAILIPTALVCHLSFHDVNLPVALSLLLGSLPGTFIGSKLCNILPETIVRPAIATVLVIAGTRLV